MTKKQLFVAIIVISIVWSSIPDPMKAQGTKIKIAFVPGTVDPFYQTMQKGIEQAAADLGVEVVTQVPQSWDTAVQTPIINALAADKSINALITAAVDKDQMVPVLQAVDKAGIPVISVDTFIGNGDYAKGPVTFPLSYIGSDNEEGGRIACNALAEAIGKKGDVYIQNVNPGISTTDQREAGCKAALATYSDIKLVGVDYNSDDASKSQAQTTAVLQRDKNLAGIFGTNVFSAEGAGTAVVNAGLKGAVQVVAFDASTDAIQKLKDGTVSLVIAQKPYDMGYTALGYAVAYLKGVTSLPKRVPTGYAVITPQNMTDPAITRFFYSSAVGTPQPPLANFKIAYVPGVVDPFYVNLQHGIEDAAQMLNVKVVTQVPQSWDVAVQTPIINALASDKTVSTLISAPVDKDQMVPVLQAVDKAGIPVITVDQYIGDGNYVNGSVTFPLSYISSDNEEGGRIACDALAAAINKTGKVYIQNVTPGISATDLREKGCKEALAAYPDIKLVGVDYNGDDASKSQAQTTAVLQREKDLAGIFGTNVFSAEGAGTAVVNAGLKGTVQVVAFDASRDAIEKLYDGIVTLVIAQKPYDMGFLAAFYAIANARGVSSIPKRLLTGFVVIDIKNVSDPDVSRFIYR
jgi:ribose transport system substrate-binding protein